MIAYIEEFLGLADGSLSTDWGIALTLTFMVIFFYALVKVILIWLENIFGR